MSVRSFLLLPLLAACADPPTSDGLEPGDPHVLVIIMDGVRVDEVTGTWASDLTEMTGEEWAVNLWTDVAPDATVVRSILNPVLTSTGPGHAAIVTGRPEEVMTVSFQLERGAELYRPTIPTIFEEARKQLNYQEEDAVLMANAVVMQSVNESIYPGYEDYAGTWNEITEPLDPESVETDDTRAIALLQRSIAEGPPPLFVVNLHDADRAGHADNDYPGHVEEQDIELAGLWNWIAANRKNYLDNLLVVITADHGRHRHDMDFGYEAHGDSCDGCREVPLFVLGTGVTKGKVEDSGGYSLIDIAPTLASHLGIDLPWGQGLPLSPLVEGASGGRTGEVEVSSSNGHVATQVWLDDFHARSEIQVDGEVVSTPGIYSAENPTLYVGDSASIVCFRELSEEVEDGFYPWRPRCLANTGSGWEDIGFPDDYTGPFFEATIDEKDGSYWISWLYTPRTRDVDGTDGIRLARWTPTEGWDDPQGTSIIFTSTAVTFTPTTSGFLLAATTNLNDPDEPYTRRTTVFTFDEEGVDDGNSVDFQLEELTGETRRVEHPTLTADGDTVHLGMLAMEPDRTFPAWVESTDGGHTWGTPTAMPTQGQAFTHLPLQWDGAWLVWGALIDDEAALCRATVTDTAPSCVSTGATRLDSFSAHDGVATVSVDTGTGQWELGEVRW